MAVMAQTLEKKPHFRRIYFAVLILILVNFEVILIETGAVGLNMNRLNEIMLHIVK